MSTKQEEFLRKYQKDLKEMLDALLYPYFQGESKYYTSSITNSELDRSQADKVDWEQAQDKLADYNTVDMTAACQMIHEANRQRRDLSISRTSHKNQMKASLQIMYGRENYIKDQLDE